ncbi:ChaN family lipoprotein [Salinarimonas rosea]|uniref:ChaN family lipoprotein n=1 Tax=Salinarimonas rosea TaxID=552063 RepID=UPI000406B755|nr:ChaN family lipoprotein [Salinarimonas rosea]
MRPITTALLAGLAAAIASPAAGAPAPPAFVGGTPADAPLVGAIRDARTGAALTPADVAARIAGAEIVLLGERHDNPDHHALQAWAVAVAAAEAPAGGLVLEMVRRDEGGPLAEAEAGDVTALGEALGWEESGWPDFSMYAPVLEAALDAGWTLHAGDVERTLMTALAQGDADALAPDERARLALDRPLPEPGRLRMEQAIVDGHCGLLPEAAVPGFAVAQRLRDAVLADALLAAPSPAVLIAGAGHVGTEAVPFYLDARAPEREVLSIAFVEVPPGVVEPADLVAGFGGPDAPYDVAWFTPGVERGDVCADLRARFGGG